MSKFLEDKRKRVEAGIKQAFKDQFGLEPDESENPFETCWPISAWDMIHTETRSFNVHLKLATGKVLSITEEL